MEQRVSGPRLKPLQGVLLVLLIAVFLFAAQFVLILLQQILSYFKILEGTTVYTVASIGYWLVGGILAVQMIRRYVLNYVYTANTKQLRIERVYGPGRPRHVEDVFFSKLRAIGSVEEMRGRFPNAKQVKAVHLREELPRRALAYDTTDGTKILIFQPNDELWEIMTNTLKENSKK